jgi:hypothetical protein
VPPEGVVNALHRIHAALVPGGLVVDTQPVSARPPVETAGRRLGELDMRPWRALIDEIDELFAATIAAGLFAVEHEHHLVVTDAYDTGAELLETVADWKGTRIPTDLASRLTTVTESVSVHQTVRLRVLRAVARTRRHQEVLRSFTRR